MINLLMGDKCTLVVTPVYMVGYFPQLHKNKIGRIFLAFQWFIIHFPMQGTQVPSLVRELRSHVLQDNEAHVLQ